MEAIVQGNYESGWNEVIYEPISCTNFNLN